jgi:predicted RNA-binding protein YlxR (DUF448 family)
MKNRKIPMRRCVGCMTSKPKKELIRLVAENGIPRIDGTGKANGRGVYLCANGECLEKALKKNAVARGLSIEGFGADDKERFRETFRSYIPKAEV